ncbi:MAG: GldG family protein [Spirochaetaceae bacterium]|nr:GldG family protein [Spirochaetaceae bacterium]
MKNKMKKIDIQNNKKGQAVIITALSLVIVVLAIVLSYRLWFRADLTKNNIYTISEVSRNLYTEIPDQVRITYFRSARLSTISAIPGEIEDILREYVAYSHGKITLVVRDPETANLSAEVEQLGMTPQRMQVTEKNQASVAIVYSGILLEYLDKTQVMPWVFSMDNLEYNLTSQIRSLVSGASREIGILIGDSWKTLNNDYQYVAQVLESNGYKMRQINAGDDIPLSLAALFVFGGAQSFDDYSLYRIDRYLQQGGNALFATEGIYTNAFGNLNEVYPYIDSRLLAMLKNYGATIDTSYVMQVQNLLMLPTQQMFYMYPFWFATADTGKASDETADWSAGLKTDFAGIDLFWPSPIKLSTPAGVESRVLFQSLPVAKLLTGDQVSQYAQMPYMNPILPNMTSAFAKNAEDAGVQVLGAALRGPLPSYFAGKEKPTREGGEELPDMPTQAESTRIVLIGDSDFASTLLQFNGAERNMNYLLNLTDFLTADEDVAAIQRKPATTGRLDKITDEEKRLGTENFAQWFNIVVVPFIVLVIAIVRIALRRRRENEI